MEIIGHGVIIVYTTEGRVIYCNTNDEEPYIDILKDSGVMNKSHMDSMHTEEWKDYSIFLDIVELEGDFCNIVHILPKVNKVEYFRQLAYRDCLTGLYNRNFWEDIKAGSVDVLGCDNYTIILLDMDNLKNINMATGHRGGDKAIKNTAYAIKNSIRDTDIAFRIGGDEFLILIPGREGEIAARKIVYRIKGKLARLNICDDTQASISAGYASGKGLKSLEETANIADRRMFEEKRNKKGLLPVLDKATLCAIREYIEESRRRLDDLITESIDGDLSSEALLKASQELDELINIYMKMVGKRDLNIELY